MKNPIDKKKKQKEREEIFIQLIDNVLDFWSSGLKSLYKFSYLKNMLPELFSRIIFFLI